jgi:hypothetical protein
MELLAKHWLQWLLLHLIAVPMLLGTWRNMHASAAVERWNAANTKTLVQYFDRSVFQIYQVHVKSP